MTDLPLWLEGRSARGGGIAAGIPIGVHEVDEVVDQVQDAGRKRGNEVCEIVHQVQDQARGEHSRGALDAS